MTNTDTITGGLVGVGTDRTGGVVALPGTAPQVIEFDSVARVITPQGHRLRPLVDGRPDGRTPGMGICLGGLDVPPAFIAAAHRHDHTDVIVLVLACGAEGALTLYGPQLEYEAWQRPTDDVPVSEQVLTIPRGWPHTVINLSLTEPIRALEARSNRTVVDDNPVLPGLQQIANERGLTRLRELHGGAPVADARASLGAARSAPIGPGERTGGDR